MRLASTLALAAVLSLGGATLADENRFVFIDNDHAIGNDGEPTGWLGVSVGKDENASDGGARVLRVVEDSPAARAGLERGDLIVSLDGDAVNGPAGLTGAVREREPGDRVTLEIVRDGRTERIDVELGDLSAVIAERVRIRMDDLHIDLDNLTERLSELGEHGLHLDQLGNMEMHLDGLRHLEHLEHLGNLQFLGEDGAHVRIRCENGECENMKWHARSRPMLGVSLTETTPELRRHLGGSDDEGALVGRVVQDSAADRAGIEVGDLIVAIDGESVSDSFGIRQALAEKAGQTVRVDVIREGASVSLDATLPEAPARRSAEEPARSRGPRT